MIAHINENGEEQSIKEHLQGTAERAAAFAAEFGCADIGYLCGLMHDIGKYSDEFQRRIQDPEHTRKVDHSTAGAKELIALSGNYIPMAMAVAGHHSGLLDGGNPSTSYAQDGTFFGRLNNCDLPEYGAWKEEIVPQTVSIPEWCKGGNSPRLTMSFFIRMIFSCLVDADYLDTENFMLGHEAVRGGYHTPDELLKRFETYIEPWLQGKSRAEGRQKELCEARNLILQNCMKKGAACERGIFTLTVPTGGGKTTASLGFALNQMCSHKMKRVIYVIPYTSIIDQNALVFSKILGEENVVEHHSGIIYETGIQSETSHRKMLATENWDAPVIVTTAVQFFESLYACKTSKCRKLHNIANSVIIFDEAQTIPVPYLEPCVAVMAELVKNYRASVVLCTATQPSLQDMFQKYYPDAPIQEICDNVPGNYHLFRRTQIHNVGEVTTEALCEKLSSYKQVLCIVNKRKTAQLLYQQMKGEGVYCLTTLLCPAHRKEKIAEIKERLRDGHICRVIATSLIEAGVDVDFPAVYRQEAGLDSVIQAAGRCNREGKKALEDSRVCIFRLPEERDRFLAQNIDSLRWTQKSFEDIASLEAIDFYFSFYRELLGKENLDQKKILSSLGGHLDGKIFPFSSVAQMFRLIEKDTQTVYIPIDQGEELIQQIADGKADKNTFRRLGQYGVNVYPDHFEALWKAGCIEPVGDMIYVLRDMNQYCKEGTGLQMDVETGYGIMI